MLCTSPYPEISNPTQSHPIHFSTTVLHPSELAFIKSLDGNSHSNMEDHSERGREADDKQEDESEEVESKILWQLLDQKWSKIMFDAREKTSAPTCKFSSWLPS